MLTRAAFPNLFLAQMLPALDTLIFNKYDRFPRQFSRMYRMMSSTREIEQTTQMSGLTLFPTIAEGAAVRYDEPVKGFDKTYLHTQFGLGFRITRIMADDDRYSIIKKLATDLGRSFAETVEILAASTFNNGTSGSYLGPDGKSLFATDHPLVKSGGTQSNKAAAYLDPDPTGIQTALTAFRKQVDSSGRKVRIKPEKLVVPPELEFAAAETLKSTNRADTANNAINALRERDGFGPFNSYFVWDYLTSPTAWMIAGAAEDTEIRFYWREQFNTIHDVDFDTRSLKTAGWARFSYGWSDFQGVYGVF